MITRQPRKGDRLERIENWNNHVDFGHDPRWVDAGTVDHLDGNLCHYKRPDGTPDLFIWRFTDRMNRCFRITENEHVETNR